METYGKMGTYGLSNVFFSIAIGFKLYNYGYLNEEKEVLSLTALPKTLDLQHFF